MFDARTPGGTAKYLLVTDNGKPMGCHRTGNALRMGGRLASVGRRTWYVYWCSSPSLLARNLVVPGAPTEADAGALPSNLVKNPEFALGNPLPVDWSHDTVAPSRVWRFWSRIRSIRQ